MSSRTRQNPGIELNEIDRSYYGKVDNSLPNSPISYMLGFADQGESMTFEWIDSKNTLDETFGIPTTEFESYLYNAAIEALNRGGTCVATKLPYKNDQFQKYNYVDFEVSQLNVISGSYKSICADIKYETIGDIYENLIKVIDALPSNNEYTNIHTINDMANVVIDICNKYSSLSVYEISSIQEISANLAAFISSYVWSDDFSLLYLNDTNLTSYLNISTRPNTPISNDILTYGNKSDISELDNLLTHQKGSLSKNTIRIYDMTRAKYLSLPNSQCISSDSISAWTNECLGIVPVIVTPTNAMFFQNLLSFNAMSSYNDLAPNYDVFNNLLTFATKALKSIHQCMDNISAYMSMPLASTSLIPTEPLVDIDSLSKRSAKAFPAINYCDASHFDKTNLKKIGVVVFKAFKDSSNYGKISFQLLESFVGALDKNAQDSITKANIFIDNVVNQNSQFIRLFSNVDPHLVEQATTYASSLQPAISLGFYKEECKKDISYVDSIVKPLGVMLDKASNANQLPLDIVVDAGMSNIAQLVKQYAGLDGVLHTDDNPSIGDYEWKFGPYNSDVSGWKLVLSRFDNLCKNMRKDCMFIADGLRPLCLEGNQKIVRPTKPQNTVANAIIPNFRYIAGAIDSSYSAGYCNWYLQRDYSNNIDYIWIPPSIKAMGAYIYCDTYFHPWSAPAGHTRGIVGDAIDIAFVPSDDDAGVIYSNSWNYAMSYPIDGIVIEGHKTFQSQRTALDRVNVRRLMLSLEKRVATAARSFVYEQNTPFIRQQFVDTIRPILDDAVSGNGISEYGIKCDDEINTPQVIDNNELRCKIAVKPIKAVDWIILNMICVNQTANITEELTR